MREETTEHVGQSVKVFLWLIFPLGVASVLSQLFLFKENMLGPVLWSVLIYFYSNFLPDLPSIHRKKESEIGTTDLAWYKKYALLLFAPLLVWLLFSGMRSNWKTEETYHNLGSAAIYGVFLFAVGFLGFAGFPLRVEDLVKVFFFVFCGTAGFLAHLKVDKIW
jgi:hypothetical protein